MKQKQRKHLYESKHRKASMRMWLMLVKAWRYEYQINFGIIKHRHKRTWARRDQFKIWGRNSVEIVLYSRPAKPIGRKKHGKWLYMPKRVLLRGNKNDKNPIFI